MIATCTLHSKWSCYFYVYVHLKSDILSNKESIYKNICILIILYNYVKKQVLQILFMQVKIVLVILESSCFSENMDFFFEKKPSCIFRMFIVHLKECLSCILQIFIVYLKNSTCSISWKHIMYLAIVHRIFE